MLVPRLAGVYLLHDLRGVLYVGSTRDLYRRFDQHYWLTANDLIEQAMRQPFGELTFSWFLVAEDGRRTALERLLIGWLLPPCNRVIPSNPFNPGE
jgi:predicted GIY-YIG superfamily endonuclease